jgi:hydroxymethylpyrimidine pyrophosphatase-like HAD family hydrolase
MHRPLRVAPVSAPKIDLIVTDLDGTLWDDRGEMHPDTVGAMTHLSSLGVPVLAATARRPASALATMQENGVVLPAVLFDGSLGRDFIDGTTFHHRVFDVPSARGVLDACMAGGLEPSLNIDHPSHDFVIGDRPSSHPKHLVFNADRTTHADLPDAVQTTPIFSFLIIGRESQALVAVLEAVHHLAAGSVTPDRIYGGHSLSIRPKGVSKWSGVLAFCAARRLDPARVLALGDGDNDIELLSAASIACVPLDGCEAALSVATHRIGPARDGGWASVVDLVG